MQDIETVGTPTTSIPGLNPFSFTVTGLGQLNYLIHIPTGIPGVPKRPPYSPTYVDPSLKYPINNIAITMTDEEVYNNLSKYPLTPSEVATLKSALYPVSYKAVAVGTSIISLDTSTNASRGLISQIPGVTLNPLEAPSNIYGTNYILTSEFGAPSNFIWYIYEYGTILYHKNVPLIVTGPSKIAHKFGTNFLL